jgi:hypothetical protein
VRHLGVGDAAVIIKYPPALTGVEPIVDFLDMWPELNGWLYGDIDLLSLGECGDEE